jgi:hypothetical protein
MQAVPAGELRTIQTFEKEKSIFQYSGLHFAWVVLTTGKGK